MTGNAPDVTVAFEGVCAHPFGIGRELVGTLSNKALAHSHRANMTGCGLLVTTKFLLQRNDICA